MNHMQESPHRTRESSGSNFGYQVDDQNIHQHRNQDFHDRPNFQENRQGFNQEINFYKNQARFQSNHKWGQNEQNKSPSQNFSNNLNFNQNNQIQQNRFHDQASQNQPQSSQNVSEQCNISCIDHHLRAAYDISKIPNLTKPEIDQIYEIMKNSNNQSLTSIHSNPNHRSSLLTEIQKAKIQKFTQFGEHMNKVHQEGWEAGISIDRKMVLMHSNDKRCFNELDDQRVGAEKRHRENLVESNDYCVPGKLLPGRSDSAQGFNGVNGLIPGNQFFVSHRDKLSGCATVDTKTTSFRAQNQDGETFDGVRRYLDEVGPNIENVRDSRTQHFEKRNSRESSASRDLRQTQKFESGNLFGQLLNGDPSSDRYASRNGQERMNQERNNFVRFNQNQNNHQQFSDKNNSFRGQDWGGNNFSRDNQRENGFWNNPQAHHSRNNENISVMTGNQNYNQFSENKENMGNWMNSSPLKPTSSESNESLERKSNSLESFQTTRPIITGRNTDYRFNNQGFNNHATNGHYSQNNKTDTNDFGNAPLAANFTNNRFDYRRGSIDSQATVIPTQEILERQDKTTDENNNRIGW